MSDGEGKQAEMTWVLKRSVTDPDKFDKLKMIYGLAILFAIIAAFATKNLVLPVVCLVVLVASTYEFFGGRKFALTQTVAKSGPNEIAWGAVRSVHVRSEEIYLSPFSKESKLDAFRGVKLSIQNVSKENVLEFIREHVGQDVQFLGE